MIQNPPNLNLKITDPIQYQLLGCVFYGDPFHSANEWSYHNEIGKLWTRFMGLLTKYQDFFKNLTNRPNESYEVHLEPHDYDKINNKKYYVFIGISIENFSEIPLEMFIKTLPKTQYLEFSTSTKNYSLAETVLKEELGPNTKYKQSFPYIILRYDRKRYKGLNNPDSYLDWLIPIKKRMGGDLNI